MDFKIANAMQAYAKALDGVKQSSGTDSTSGIGSTAGASGNSFADMVSKAVGQSVDAERTSEKTSLQSIAKGTDLTGVVTAVTNAEVTLDTVVAVRDRIIGAYQDIIKMPI